MGNAEEQFYANFSEYIEKERAEGKAEGIAECRAEGKARSKRKTAIAMLLDNRSEEKITKYTGLTSQEIAEIKKDLLEKSVE